MVQMPALRDHREDIPEPAARILIRKAHGAGQGCPALTRSILDRLVAFDWAGNVRELEHALEHYLPFRKPPDVVRRPGRDPREWENDLDDVVHKHVGNIAATARELRISRKAVYKGLKRRMNALDTEFQHSKFLVWRPRIRTA